MFKNTEHMPFERWKEIILTCQLFKNLDAGRISEQQTIEQLDEKYNLKPEKSLFIDDHEENIEAGKKLGINGLFAIIMSVCWLN